MSTLSIRHDPDQHILIVKRTGTFEAQRSMADLDKIIAAMQQKEVYRVLVDHRETELKVDTTDVFEVGYNITHTDAGLLIHKLALLYAYEKNDPKLEHYRFFEAMLVNRGLNVGLFWGDTQPAIEWLLAND